MGMVTTGTERGGEDSRMIPENGTRTVYDDLVLGQFAGNKSRSKETSEAHAVAIVADDC